MALNTVCLSDLKAHAGGLVRLNVKIFWWGGRGWDNETDTICLLLETSSRPVLCEAVTAARGNSRTFTYVKIFIDDAPRWIQIHDMDDIELLHGDAE